MELQQWRLDSSSNLFACMVHHLCPSTHILPGCVVQSGSVGMHLLEQINCSSQPCFGIEIKNTNLNKNNEHYIVCHGDNAEDNNPNHIILHSCMPVTTKCTHVTTNFGSHMVHILANRKTKKHSELHQQGEFIHNYSVQL